MKNQTYTLNTILALVVGLACLAWALCRAFLPATVLPGPGLPALAALSLLALVLESFLVPPTARRPWPAVIVLGVLTFGLLPLCGGLVALDAVPLLALAGGVLFTALTFLFTSLRERLSSGPAGRLAPVLTACILFLACQSLAGMVL